MWNYVPGLLLQHALIGSRQVGFGGAVLEVLDHIVQRQVARHILLKIVNVKLTQKLAVAILPLAHRWPIEFLLHELKIHVVGQRFVVSPEGRHLAKIDCAPRLRVLAQDLLPRERLGQRGLLGNARYIDLVSKGHDALAARIVEALDNLT
jgi:hypothetical protein